MCNTNTNSPFYDIDSDPSTSESSSVSNFSDCSDCSDRSDDSFLLRAEFYRCLQQDARAADLEDSFGLPAGFLNEHWKDIMDAMDLDEVASADMPPIPPKGILPIHPNSLDSDKYRNKSPTEPANPVIDYLSNLDPRTAKLVMKSMVPRKQFSYRPNRFTLDDIYLPRKNIYFDTKTEESTPFVPTCLELATSRLLLKGPGIGKDVDICALETMSLYYMEQGNHHRHMERISKYSCTEQFRHRIPEWPDLYEKEWIWDDS